MNEERGIVNLSLYISAPAVVFKENVMRCDAETEKKGEE